MIAARVAFWRRAAVEGWEPTREGARVTAPAVGGEGLPLAYRLEGASPGRWPKEAQATPEWRRWKRLRDRVYDDHGGLVVSIVQPRVARYPGADLEDAWTMARIQLLRGIDLYDPERPHPRTGEPLAPATYLGRWVLNGWQAGLRIWRRSQIDTSYTPLEEVLGGSEGSVGEDSAIDLLDLSPSERAELEGYAD